jgi:hypothetical protein
MLKLKNETIYLFCLFLFKTAVGALLLLIGWDALNLKGDSILNVTLVTGVAFLPAAFARPLYTRVAKHEDSKLIFHFMWIASLLVLLELIWMKVVNGSIYVFSIFHFILWILIFLVEVSFERWFVRISKTLEAEAVSKLSAVSMGLIQLGIIVGPVVIGISKKIDVTIPYVLTAILFIICAIYSRSAKPVSISESSVKIVNPHELLITTAFALVWPTIATFNMAVPLAVKLLNSTDINLAMLIEVALAVGSSMIGFVMSRLKSPFNTTVIFLGIVISAFAFTIFSFSIELICLSSFFLGLFYGSMRISARAVFARLVEPKDAGTLMARANAFSAPIVILYLFCAYLEYSKFKTFFSMGLAYSLSGYLFYKLVRTKK